MSVHLYHASADNPCPEAEQLITSYTIAPKVLNLYRVSGAFVNGDDFVTTAYQQSLDKAPSGRHITEAMYHYYDASTGELTEGTLARYGLEHEKHYLGSWAGGIIPRVSGTNSPGFLVSYSAVERQENASEHNLNGHEYNLYTHFVDADFSVKTEVFNTKINRPSPICLTPYGYDQAYLSGLDSNANYHVLLQEHAVEQFSAYKVWLYDANGQRLNEQLFYNFNPLVLQKAPFKECKVLYKADRLSASNISINNLNEISVQSIRSSYFEKNSPVKLFHRRIPLLDEN